VNGMDTTDWSPNVDKFLDVKYDADTVDEGKALAKEALQAELGLPVSSPTQPVLCMSCQMDRWNSCDSDWTVTLLHPVSSPKQPVLCISYEGDPWAARYHTWLLANRCSCVFSSL